MIGRTRSKYVILKKMLAIFHSLQLIARTDLLRSNQITPLCSGFAGGGLAGGALGRSFLGGSGEALLGAISCWEKVAPEVPSR